MAKHYLSQKDVGYITLFTISLCTTQVQADEKITPVVIDQSANKSAVQIEKPKLTFNLNKKTVDEIPSQLEKPRFKLFKPSVKPPKEHTLSPELIDQVPDIDEVIDLDDREENLQQPSNKIKAKLSFLSLRKDDKEEVVESKIITPSFVKVADGKPVEKAVPQKPVIQIESKQKNQSRSIKPELVVEKKSEIENNNLDLAKPKDPLLSFVQTDKTNKKVDVKDNNKVTQSSKEGETLVPTINQPKTLKPVIKKEVKTPKTDIVKTQQIAQSQEIIQVEDEKAHLNIVASTEKTGVKSKFKSLWPFKAQTTTEAPTQSVLTPSKLELEKENSTLSANKPVIVYSSPMNQKANIQTSSKLNEIQQSQLNQQQSEANAVSKQQQQFYNSATTEQNSQKKFSFNALKSNMDQFFKVQSDEDFRKVDLNKLSDFNFDKNQLNQLPVISTQATVDLPKLPVVGEKRKLSLYEAIRIAVARHPEISQSVSSLAAQNANIDVVKAGYFPQLSAGITTGDMTSGERGRQLFNVNATQMLFDFGKQKSQVSTERARLQASQAQVLVSIDQIALEVASAIVNIKRYEEVTRIAREQVEGISRIREIANLRAQAGISSQADPIQAQSYYEAAQSNLIVQQTQLGLFKQRLRTLMGMDISNIEWEIPNTLISSSDIYAEPQFNEIPKMMLAQAEVNIAEFEKKQTQLSRYPTLNVKGTLSQAVNGRNPNNNQDDGTDSSIMFEASSNFYQGGATSSRTRAASFAEEAAKAKVNAIYLETLDGIRLAQEQVENKQKQMKVLSDQQRTSVRTKELYQEQYKLGTRTAVDLLNAEQAIHRANSDIESARYDIYENLVQYISSAGKSRDVYQLNHLIIQGVELKP